MITELDPGAFSVCYLFKGTDGYETRSSLELEMSQPATLDFVKKQITRSITAKHSIGDKEFVITSWTRLQ